MKPIRIITIHCIPNFGSVFQSFGLLHFLIKNNIKATLINYCPNYFSKGRNRFRMLAPIFLHPIDYFIQKKKYSAFLKESLLIDSDPIINYKGLSFYKNENSLFIAGGDQLWNPYHPCGNDDAYKLTFVEKGIKMSYGTSIGQTKLSEKELINLASKTKDFKTIGLREQSTVSLFAPYSNVEVYHASDPVLLLDKKDYMQFIGHDRLIKEPYMLVYMAKKSDILSATVKQIAVKYNLKIVHCIGFSKKCECDYFLKNTGPKDLLNLLFNADFVVSASFHATLFSVLFQKNFYTLLPGVKVNTRIEDWLSFCNLEDRIIKDVSDLSRTNDIIDYSRVTPKVQLFAEKSRNRLISEIEKYIR